MSVSLADLLTKCLDNEDGYKKYGDVIANYVADPSKNIKLQMPIVNVVKQTIKSKSHTTLQKLLSLKLLNRCFNKDNKEFNRYVEKKILERLGIFAQHNKEKTEDSDLIYKGELIFSGSEKDRRSAAAFLVLLLDCLERWARMMPLEQNGKSQSEFAKTYTMLLQKKIVFPSQCKACNPFNELGLIEEGQVYQKQAQRGVTTQGSSSSTGSSSRANTSTQCSVSLANLCLFNKSQHQKDTSGQAPSRRLDAQKIAADLKSRMMRAKDTAKKSEAFLAKLESSGFQADPQEYVAMDEMLQSGREHCEFCVESLMSEEIGPLIANKEELLDRMLKYQEQILTAIAIIAPFVESVKQQEVSAFKSYNQQKKQNRATAVQAFQTSPNQEPSQKGSSTLEILSSLFPTQQNQIDKNDPFAEAVMETYNQQKQPASGQDDFFFNQQNPLAQQQQPDFNFEFPTSYQQQQPVPPQEVYSPQNQAHETEPEVVPEQEEQKVVVGNGGDNYSVFRMMQEGMLDLDKEKAAAKKKKEQQLQQQQQAQQYALQQQQQQQQHQQEQDYYYQQHQQQYHQQPVQQQYHQEPDYAGGKLSDYAAAQHQGNDSWNDTKMKDLEKQVRQLKQQNTEMLTSNQMLKQRLENLKQAQDYQQNSYQNDYQLQQMQLQNQQLEIQINNMRDYYEREIENKDHQLRLRAQEVDSLRAEVEALRSGQPPEAVPRSQDAIASMHNHRSEPMPHESPSRSMAAKSLEYKSAGEPGTGNYSQIGIEATHEEPKPEEEVPHQEEAYEGEVYQPNTEGYDKKTDSLYLKGLLADKMLVYDDANIKIGCIRSVSTEWRQATLKLYLGNKSATSEINNVIFTKEIQFMSIRDEESQPFMVDPNDQLEVQIYVGAQVHVQPYIYFQYGSEDSQRVKLKLPVNLIFFCEPFNITAPQFLQFWKFSKNHVTMRFNMDLTRVSNLQAVKKLLTLNEKHGSFIQGIDAKPNIVGYSATHLEGQVFAMLEISPTGTGSLLQVKSEVNLEFSQSILECFLDMLSSRQ